MKFPDWQIDKDYQKFLDLICSWSGGIKTWTLMPSHGWDKVFINWQNNKLNG